MEAKDTGRVDLATSVDAALLARLRITRDRRDVRGCGQAGRTVIAVMIDGKRGPESNATEERQGE